MEEAGEVEEVGPEEDPPRGSGAEGEAEEPLEGGLGGAPEPSGVSDLGCGGEKDSGGDGGGDEGHGEAVKGRDGTERYGTARPKKNGEEEVEQRREDQVERDGGEEEGPGGTPRLCVAPPEPHDGRVLGEPVGQGLADHNRWLIQSLIRWSERTVEASGGGGGGCVSSSSR